MADYLNEKPGTGESTSEERPFVSGTGNSRQEDAVSDSRQQRSVDTEGVDMPEQSVSQRDINENPVDSMPAVSRAGRPVYPQAAFRGTSVERAFRPASSEQYQPDDAFYRDMRGGVSQRSVKASGVSEKQGRPQQAKRQGTRSGSVDNSSGVSAEGQPVSQTSMAAEAPDAGTRTVNQVPQAAQNINMASDASSGGSMPVVTKQDVDRVKDLDVKEDAKKLADDAKDGNVSGVLHNDTLRTAIDEGGKVEPHLAAASAALKAADKAEEHGLNLNDPSQSDWSELSKAAVTGALIDSSDEAGHDDTVSEDAFSDDEGGQDNSEHHDGLRDEDGLSEHGSKDIHDEKDKPRSDEKKPQDIAAQKTQQEPAVKDPMQNDDGENFNKKKNLQKKLQEANAAASAANAAGKAVIAMKLMQWFTMLGQILLHAVQAALGFFAWIGHAIWSALCAAGHFFAAAGSFLWSGVTWVGSAIVGSAASAATIATVGLIVVTMPVVGIVGGLVGIGVSHYMQTTAARTDDLVVTVDEMTAKCMEDLVADLETRIDMSSITELQVERAHTLCAYLKRMENPAEQPIVRLTSGQWTLQEIAGILGNWTVESGLEPLTIECLYSGAQATAKKLYLKDVTDPDVWDKYTWSILNGDGEDTDGSDSVFHNYGYANWGVRGAAGGSPVVTSRYGRTVYARSSSSGQYLNASGYLTSSNYLMCGIGLGGWTADRAVALLSFADRWSSMVGSSDVFALGITGSQLSSWANLETQFLFFIMDDDTSRYDRARGMTWLNAYCKDYQGASVEECEEAFREGWEGNSVDTDKRKAWASYWYTNLNEWTSGADFDDSIFGSIDTTYQDALNSAYAEALRACGRFPSGGGNTVITDDMISLGIERFSQGDSRWANVRLGSSSETIRRSGCTTTSIAMMESYRQGRTIYPDEMVQKLSYNSSGAISPWPSDYTTVTDSSNYLSRIYELLRAGKPVLFGSKTNAGGQHWIVITGWTGGELTEANFTINDPGDARRTTLQDFRNAFPIFYKYLYYNDGESSLR